MRHQDFTVGGYFVCHNARWRVTDIGVRTVIAIPVKEGWMNGPPYALAETVFDENDMPGCIEDVA